MNMQTAKEAVLDMHRAHGREAPDGVVARLAFAMLQAKCPTCGLEAVREAGDYGGRALTVPAFHEALAARMEKPAHLPHISETTTEARVSTEETFWRTDGAKAIQQAADLTPLEARFLAAKMWGSRAVPMNASQIADEFDESVGSIHIWERAHLRGAVTVEAVETAFLTARTTALQEVTA